MGMEDLAALNVAARLGEEGAYPRYRSVIVAIDTRVRRGALREVLSRGATTSSSCDKLREGDRKRHSSNLLAKLVMGPR